MKSLLKFSFILIISFFVLPTALSRQTFAQEPGDVFNQSVQQKIDDEKAAREKEKQNAGELQVYSTRVNNQQLGDSMFNLTNMIICTDPVVCGKQPTALNSITQMIASLYQNPPASGLAYTRDLLANAGFIAKPVYAQGVGFAGLSPILPLWKVTRNIAYICITIVMVIIGFMVIFRMKMDPKTVVSVQAALPKIVLTLVLITLSYPIVGFLVDIMYLLIAVVVAVIAQGTGQADKIPGLQALYINGNLGTLFGQVFGAGIQIGSDYLFTGWNPALFGGASAIGAMVANFAGMASLLSLSPGFWGAIAVPLILILIIGLGLLFTFVRIALLLLNSYIQLIIAIILGPLQLMTEAIPGRSAFSDWIRTVMANLIVFPATVAILMFSTYIAMLNTETSNLLTPPLVWIPGNNTWGAFLSMGILFLAPQLIAQAKKMFNAKPVLPISAGTAFAPLTGAAQTGMGAASQFYYMKQMPGINKLFGGGGGGHGGGH